MKWKTPVLVTAAVAIAAVVFFYYFRYLRPDPTLTPALASVVDDYRKIIVLMEGSESLDEATRARCEAAGQVLFWYKRRSLDDIAAKFADPSGRSARIRQFVRYLTSDPALHDADKLALLDLVSDLAAGSPQADLRALLDNLQSISWPTVRKSSGFFGSSLRVATLQPAKSGTPI